LAFADSSSMADLSLRTESDIGEKEKEILVWARATPPALDGRVARPHTNWPQNPSPH
jgi:hypothetical protein